MICRREFASLPAISTIEGVSWLYLSRGPAEVRGELDKHIISRDNPNVLAVLCRNRWRHASSASCADDPKISD